MSSGRNPAMYETSSVVRVRPRFRGVSHQWAFVASVGLGIALVVTTHGTRPLLAAMAFACSVSAMFAASALYHRVMWPTAQRRRLFAKLDHAAIYLLISGTHTPIGLIVLRGAWRPTILGIVWTGAGAAILLKLFRGNTPKWVPAGIALGLGWVAIVALPELLRIGWAGSSLMLAGGLCYTMGALVYARGRPDPRPAVFGYHEVFHALVVAAVVFQYAAIAFFVLPRG